MLRIFFGVIAGFLAWLIAWFGSEKLFSAIWPDGFGAQQLAFEAALVNGGQFSAQTSFLLTHILCGAAVSMMSGFLSALIAGENKRTPLVLGLLLLALGLLKAVMSWPYVPVWYHVVFTAMLLPMTIAGGKLKAASKQ